MRAAGRRNQVAAPSGSSLALVDCPIGGGSWAGRGPLPTRPCPSAERRRVPAPAEDTSPALTSETAITWLSGCRPRRDSGLAGTRAAQVRDDPEPIGGRNSAVLEGGPWLESADEF